MLLKKLKILLLEDSPLDAELICREIKAAQIVCNTVIVDCEVDYVKALTEFSPDLILSDHTLLSFSSLDALRIAVKKLPKIPFILVTGTMSEEFAVNVMKEGAWDYVSKNQLRRLPDAIINAMDKFNYGKLRQKFLYDLILNEAYMQEAERIANYGSWEVDVMSKSIKWSRESCNILGYEHGDREVLYDNILTIIHPDESLHVKQVIKQIIKNPLAGTYKETFRLVDKDGLYRVIKVEFVLKHNGNNELIRINGFIENVTNSMPAKEMLLESEQRFLCLAENISEAIFSLNASGYIVHSNHEARKIFGYNANEISNKHISLIYENQGIYNRELINHLKTKEDSGRFETKSCFESKNGLKLWTNTTVSAFNNNAGDLSGFIMIISKAAHSIIAAATV